MDEEQEESFNEEEPIIEEEVEETPPPSPEAEEEPMVARTSIPITLTVELGKVKLNADKVLALEPGNVLELNRAPGERVDLISGGKKIGTGELLRVGDVLGVRILELG